MVQSYTSALLSILQLRMYLLCNRNLVDADDDVASYSPSTSKIVLVANAYFMNIEEIKFVQILLMVHHDYGYGTESLKLLGVGEHPMLHAGYTTG